MKLNEILHENDEQLSQSEIYQTIMDGNGSFSMMKQERQRDRKTWSMNTTYQEINKYMKMEKAC